MPAPVFSKTYKEFIAEFWEGDKRPICAKDLIDVNSIIEDLSEAAYNICGEVAEDYLDDITKEQEQSLYEHVRNWLVYHKLLPEFYGVENIKKILEAAGTTILNIVKVSVFLKNIDDFKAMNREYKKFFDENGAKDKYPARTTVGIAALPVDSMLVEIEVIAIV